MATYIIEVLISIFLGIASFAGLVYLMYRKIKDEERGGGFYGA